MIISLSRVTLFFVFPFNGQIAPSAQEIWQLKSIALSILTECSYGHILQKYVFFSSVTEKWECGSSVWSSDLQHGYERLLAQITNTHVFRCSDLRKDLIHWTTIITLFRVWARLNVWLHLVHVWFFITVDWHVSSQARPLMKYFIAFNTIVRLPPTVCRHGTLSFAISLLHSAIYTVSLHCDSSCDPSDVQYVWRIFDTCVVFTHYE